MSCLSSLHLTTWLFSSFFARSSCGWWYVMSNHVNLYRYTVSQAVARLWLIRQWRPSGRQPHYNPAPSKAHQWPQLYELIYTPWDHAARQVHVRKNDFGSSSPRRYRRHCCLLSSHQSNSYDLGKCLPWHAFFYCWVWGPSIRIVRLCVYPLSVHQDR